MTRQTELDASQIAAKLNGFKRREVPNDCTRLTMFVDIHGTELYWLVAAWGPDFTCYIIDYSRQTVRRDEGVALEDAIRDSLENLLALQLWRQWKREDGRNIQIACCMIDANWGRVTDLVREFCTKNGLRVMTRLLPARGRYVGAASVPFAVHCPQPDEHTGNHWRTAPSEGVLHDTNYWKSFVRDRLALPAGSAGGLSIFGKDPDQHRLLSNHLTAEYSTRTEGRGRTVDEWALPANNVNHWLECLVGCAVAEAICVEYRVKDRSDAEGGEKHHCCYCEARLEEIAFSSDNCRSSDYPWAIQIPVVHVAVDNSWLKGIARAGAEKMSDMAFDCVLAQGEYKKATALPTVKQAAENLRKINKTLPTVKQATENLRKINKTLPTVKQATENTRKAFTKADPDNEWKLRCGCCKNEVRISKHLIPCARCETRLCPNCRLCTQDGLIGKGWWVHHAVVCPLCWPEYQSPEVRYRMLDDSPPMPRELIDASEKERNEA